MDKTFPAISSEAATPKFDYEGAKKAGYSDGEIQSFLKRKATRTGGDWTDFIPAGTAILGGTIGTILGPGGTIGGAGVGAASGEAMRQSLKAIQGEGPQLGQQDIAQPLKSGAIAAGVAAVPAVGSKVLPYLTLGGVASKVTDIVTKGQQEGPRFGKFIDTFNKYVENKYPGKLMANPGLKADAQSILSNMEEFIKSTDLKKFDFAKESRLPIQAETQIPYMRMLELRRDLGGRISDYINAILGKSGPGPEARAMVRDFLSSQIHKAYPETMRYDRLYSIYSNLLGGSLGGLLARIVAAGVATPLVGKAIGTSIGKSIGEAIK
jgi:hypothetical protein